MLVGVVDSSKLTPRTTVMSSSVAGAEMTTFFAPASRCLAAFVALGEEAGRLDDDVGAEVAPRQRARVALGEHLARVPSTTTPSSRASTVPGYGPRIESYFSRCASVLASVRSLTATHSMSAPAALGGAEDVAADAAEAVDPHAYGHAVRARSFPAAALGEPAEPVRLPASARRSRRRFRRCRGARPRSTRSSLVAGSAAARCSAIATERCRPPVQPIAITRCALPSATYCGSRKSSSGTSRS